jgi:Zn-dependent M28 family amino/carboxypeptidase
MRFGVGAAFCGALLFGLTACGGGDKTYKPERFKSGPTLGLAKAMSADELEGRKAGSEGSAAARALIIERMEKIGVLPDGPGYEKPFLYGPFVDPETGEAATPNKPGTNIIGYLEGSGDSDITMIVSAHYDHLGVREGEIYNGMDDNASGVAAMLAVAEYFAKNPPKHDIGFVAFDAEEDGFGGAREFIKNPPLPVEKIAFNLNLDMISRGDNGILWASGASITPDLIPMIEAVAKDAPVELKMGYDTGDGRDDWTLLSDHAVFFRAGVPHLYLGVEDHPDYHKPSDDFDKIDQDWFLKSVETVVMIAAAADAQLDKIDNMAGE